MATCSTCRGAGIDYLDISPCEDCSGTKTTTTVGGGTGTGTGTEPGAGDPAKTIVNCDKFPDSLGCQPFDHGEVFTPDADLVHSDLNVKTAPVSGFSGGGSCPASKTFSAFGRSYDFSMQPVCTFALHLRPVLLIISSIIALMIIFSVA